MKIDFILDLIPSLIKSQKLFSIQYSKVKCLLNPDCFELSYIMSIVSVTVYWLIP